MIHKVKQYLLVLLLMLPVLKSCSQDSRAEVARSFLKALADTSISSNTIYDSLLCKSEKLALFERNNKEKADELKREVLLQMEYFRKELTAESIDRYKLIKYKQLPEEEQNMLVDPKESDNIFVVKLNDKEITRILVNGTKIGSFVAFKKGQYRTFWLLC